MKLKALFVSLFALALFSASAEEHFPGVIEVTGSASLSITPNRINVGIGTTEYYKKIGKNDSVKVTLSQIDSQLLSVLEKAGVPDSMITLNSVGNYYWGPRDEEMLMSKRINVVLTDVSQLESLTENLNFPGITSFYIAGTDNSDIDSYNRRGLKAALDKARDKASFIAANEGGYLGEPLEISEDGPVYYEEVMDMDAAFETNAGGMLKAARAMPMSMDNLRKIVRRYNVRVKYRFIPAMR